MKYDGGSKALFASFFLLLSATVSAHTINYALSSSPPSDIFIYYLQLGYRHILPDGFDHILFILGLFLLSPKLKPLLWQATAFTVAHSITLALSMSGLISPPPLIVEPVIALSIAFVAIENIFTSKLHAWRIAVVFMFGLIHGCGFASALSEIGLPEKSFALSLAAFNIGVELGQVTIIVAAYILIGKWFSQKEWYRGRIVYPVSIVIAVIALYWTVQRTLLIV